MIVEDNSTSVIYQFWQSSIREKGDMKRNVLIASALAIYFVSILGAAFNAVPIRAEGTQAPVYPRIEKTGTYFEITNSQYLNVSITSSEVIYMILFAPTNMIDYAIESANGANSTTLTLDNMQPHAAYYMFEDSYRNEKGFQTDEKGSYTYIQDLSQKHHIFVQQKRGTIYIDKSTILYSDVHDTIEIDADNIWLDLNGFSVIAGGWIGVFLNGRSHVTIMNGTIRDCDPAGIYADGSHSITIDNVTVSNARYIGIDLVRSTDNKVNNSTILLNSWSGIELLTNAYYNRIVNNTISQNSKGLTATSWSTANYIYHNNFISNTYESEGLYNFWNDSYPSGGNYWSDYIGVDVKKGSNQNQPGSDGIGDTVKAVSGGVDYYPLMYPYGTPPPPSRTLTIQSSPTGTAFTVTGIPVTTPWSGTYAEGTSVDLTMPETHIAGETKYYWSLWADGPTSRSRTIVVNPDITATAQYGGPYYQLTVSSTPKTGITFTVDGNSKTTPYTDWLLEGSHNLEMSQTQDGYVWSRWLEDGNTNRIKTISLSGTTTWTGLFAVQTATGSGTATFITDNGLIQDLIPIDEATLPTQGKPDLEFPHGFFSFNVTGLSPGQAVSITLTLPSNMPVGTQYWKCQEGSWYRMPVSDDGGDNVIVITLTDGWTGDSDGLANGVIRDPGGLAIPPPLYVPVGGYSYAMKGDMTEKTLTLYLGLAALLSTASAVARKKTNRKLRN
jgi:parallel beta-helix repeat protein